MPVPEAVGTLTKQVIERTRGRLVDLTDQEYRWVPFENCWHAEADGQGGFRYDLEVPTPEPEPFTTLAWRLFHLMGTYSADRNAMLLGLEQGRDPLLRRAHTVAGAADAVSLLIDCQNLWLTFLDEVSEETLSQPLGEKAGAYGTATGLDLVLHQIDEHIHHAAEVALLRDLHQQERHR